MTVSCAQLSIKYLTNADVFRWDAYVFNQPMATFFHRAGWRRVLEEAFGHRAYFLYAERNGEIVGILPLLHTTSSLFGSALTAGAFAVHGGPLANDDVALSALNEVAVELAENLGVDRLEYRSASAPAVGWVLRDKVYANFSKSIDTDPDQNFLTIPRKQRAVVRQSLTHGLDAQLSDAIEINWRLYAASVHNFGTPVFPLRYFRLLKQEFEKDCEILNVYKKHQPIASCLSFYFRDQVLPYYAGSSPDARAYNAHDFMYWDILRRASLHRLRIFDFGRSKVGSGAYAFKKNWGFTPQPLTYSIRLIKAQQVPDLNPSNPKYKLLITAWKRLPLSIANIIGPVIVRGLP